MKIYFFGWLLLFSLNSFAEETCNVCFYTPKPTSEVRHGKGGNSISQGDKEQVQKLKTPIYSGDLFYSVDGNEKLSLPKNEGVFFSLPSKGNHAIRVLSATDKTWAKIDFSCSEYKYGSKIRFESSGFYSAGWKTYPLPKDAKKCPWHPEHPVTSK